MNVNKNNMKRLIFQLFLSKYTRKNSIKILLIVCENNYKTIDLAYNILNLRSINVLGRRFGSEYSKTISSVTL